MHIYSSIVDAEYTNRLINALLDLDWEVKEEALSCWDRAMVFFLETNGNVNSFDEFVVNLRPFRIVQALNISLADYDKRFLHKTYVILQKLYNHLKDKFSAEEVKHLCQTGCMQQNNEGGSPTCHDYDSSKPYQHLNNEPNSIPLVREEVISEILDEEKCSLMRQQFTKDRSNHENGQGEKFSIQRKRKVSEGREQFLTQGKKPHLTTQEEMCVFKFLHRIRYDTNFDMRLKDFDEYCQERTSLESVLNDVIHSVGDRNIIDGIDCF